MKQWRGDVLRAYRISKPKINLRENTTDNRPLTYKGKIVLWLWIHHTVDTLQEMTGQWWLNHYPTKIHNFSKISEMHGLCEYTHLKTKHLQTYWRKFNTDPNDCDWPILTEQSPLHPFGIPNFATTGANIETVTWYDQENKDDAAVDPN